MTLLSAWFEYLVIYTVSSFLNPTPHQCYGGQCAECWVPVRPPILHQDIPPFDKSLVAVLYALTKSVCGDVGLELSFYTHRSSISGPPELVLVAATVSVLKMLYGLDGHPRYESSWQGLTLRIGLIYNSDFL